MMRIGRLVALVLAVSALPAEERPPFTVGPILARPGEIVSGLVPVPAGVDEGTFVPVTVAHGAREGPVLALIAGNHGYEYAPILALSRLRTTLDARRIAGTAILVHVANVPSFLGRTIYHSPVDGKNLNRVYPGRSDGTVSERIAHVITREIIERADYVIDLHCGDGNESLRPYTYWDAGASDPNVVRASRELALAFGLDHIVVDRERPRDPDHSVYCSTTATSRGKPAITTESGGLGGTDHESISRIEWGATNVMRHLGMLEGPAARVERPVWLDRTEVLRSPATGMFEPLVERGHTVTEGTVLGRVTDFFGNPRVEVRAPFSGEVLYVVGTPPVREGEPVAMLGQVAVDPP
jgi:hypothetical protein